MTTLIDRTLERDVRIPIGNVTLEGDLGLPEGASAIVLFAHGSGSGRLSPRNRMVAEGLRKAGLATLLMDLLTATEETQDVRRRLRFDIDLLGERLIGATDWVRSHPDIKGLRIGYFGASTGAAAAMVAAQARPTEVSAIVSRGGRPDLAGSALGLVQAPTLLIVGGRDYPVIDLNRAVLNKLTGPKSLVIVPEATHLFEEPGTLEQVEKLASDWFGKYLAPPETRRDDRRAKPLDALLWQSPMMDPQPLWPAW